MSDFQNNMHNASKTAIVGATGAVGLELISLLRFYDFPSPDLFASARSKGKVIDVGASGFGPQVVQEFDCDKLIELKYDYIFLAVSGSFSLQFGKRLASGGAVVIDNSSAFRYDDDIPLVIPEINFGAIDLGKENGQLIANPNCTTAIGMMAIAPLHKLFGMKRMLMSTYQASSGAGNPGMEELKQGTKDVVNGLKEVADNEVFAHPLPFNVIPHIDKFQENGYTKEEMKVAWETRKILGLDSSFPVSCTAVRIPTFRAHSETIVIETEKKIDVEKAREVLRDAVGVKLIDDVSSDPPLYPMPLTATGKHDVEAGRVRRSEAFGDYGLEFFVSGDQLLRGAALNAVLIAKAIRLQKKSV